MNPLLAASLFAAALLGAEPTLSITETGDTVIGTLTLHATPVQVRGVLSNPLATAHLSPDTVSAEFTASGACYELSVRVRGLLNPMAMRSRRCPTADGWVEDLVASEDFKRYHQTWSVIPLDGGGTRVEYRTTIELVLPAPRVLLVESTKRSVDASLKRLAERLGEGGWSAWGDHGE
ncbi:MAG: SRPBCC family protein [Pseudomonadota bacterium]